MAIDLAEPEVAEAVEVTPAPAVVEEDSTKKSEETKTVIPEPIKEEIFDEIESVEGDERGKFKLTVGDSTYWGNTQKEAFQNLLKGKEEQDGYIRKVKAQEKVKVPVSLKERETDIPEVKLPDEQELYMKHLETATKQNKVHTSMLSWGRDEWNKYQDENALRDYEISELRQSVRDSLKQAKDMTAKDMAVANTVYVNQYTVTKETEQVQEMLAESGIDVDKFDYDEVMDAALKKRDKNGMLEPGTITALAYKQIVKIQRTKTPVKKYLEKEIEKGKTAKAEIKTGSGGEKPKSDNGKILSFEELQRQERKASERSGREI